MERVNVSVWLDKRLRNQPWSSVELTEILAGESSAYWMDEIKRLHREDKLESSIIVRILVAFFGLSPRQLDEAGGLRRSVALQLCAKVERSERDEWALLVAGFLRQHLVAHGSPRGGGGGGAVETEEEEEDEDEGEEESELARSTVDALLAEGALPAATTTDPYFVPLELASLEPASAPAASSSSSSSPPPPPMAPDHSDPYACPLHFTLSPAVAQRGAAYWSLKRTGQHNKSKGNAHDSAAATAGGSSFPLSSSSSSSSSSGTSAAGERDRGAKRVIAPQRPPSSSPSSSRAALPSAAAAAAAAPPPLASSKSASKSALPERVLKVVGEHRSLVSAAVAAAIERFLDHAAQAQQDQSSHPPPGGGRGAADTERYKVHEAVVEKEGQRFKESIYVVLDFATRTWQKTRKKKKL